MSAPETSTKIDRPDELPREALDELFRRSDKLESAIFALATAIANDHLPVDGQARTNDVAIASTQVALCWLKNRDMRRIKETIAVEPPKDQDALLSFAFAAGFTRAAQHLGAHLGELLGFGQEVMRDMGIRVGPAEEALRSAFNASERLELDLNGLAEIRALAWADQLRADAVVRQTLHRALMRKLRESGCATPDDESSDAIGVSLKILRDE